ncbi:ATPase [Lacibacter luteus]|uniref:ATPase n=1 Tax=Lacibacter luteus TaxID=2508719 RepID=A0A4Q1CJJ1_9BACT|nr:ATP-binding protein [Lacibacter luteus]RXK60538.1 ATPase [Lacibacter luteus]
MAHPKRIVLLGPESTGKSYLSEQLANHFHAVWCPEYAREYLLFLGRPYTADDLLIIAENQLELSQQYMQDAIEKKASAVFFDTDMHVMKVWSEVVFGSCDPWILDELTKQTVDFYLLCKPDIPWVQDELREYPEQDVREDLFSIYEEQMQQQSTPWAVVSGGYEERLQNAVKAINHLFT